MKNGLLVWIVPGGAAKDVGWPASALLLTFTTASRVGSRAFFDPLIVSPWLTIWIRLCASSGREEIAMAVMSWIGETGSTSGIRITSVRMMWASATDGLETPVRLSAVFRIV